MQLTINPVGGLWVVGAVMLLLLGLVFALRSAHTQLSTGRRVCLVLLRVLLIGLLFVAMIRPVLVTTEQRPQRATILLLFDGSRSMEVADSLGNQSRWDALRSIVGDVEEDLNALSEKWNVQPFVFDSGVHPIAFDKGHLQFPETVDGNATAIGNALHEAFQRASTERIAAVLLWSDGAERSLERGQVAAQLVARQLASEKIPLYTFTLGKPGASQSADLQLDDLATSSTVFAGMPTAVSGLLTTRGAANQKVQVQLLWENKQGEMEPVDSVQATITPGSETQIVELNYTPEEPGEYRVTLRAEPREGELVTSNNEVSTFVTVREGGIRVLHLVGAKRIGGGPGREQRYVRNALAASPDMIVSRVVLDYRPPNRDLRKEFERFSPDVFLLDDVDLLGLNGPTWKEIARRVENGTGLMMTGGFHSFGPGGHRNTPIADVLPIYIGRAERQNFDEAIRDDVHLSGPITLRATEPLGQMHPIMQLADGAEGWEQLAPLPGANRFGRREIKRNAMVLAESADDSHEPILVAGQSGRGRALALAVDSTWRWVMQGHEETHRRFWRQAMLWVAGRDESNGDQLWLQLNQRRVAMHSRLEFMVGASPSLRGKDGSLAIEVQIEIPSGEKKPARLIRTNDQWKVQFNELDEPGVYTIRAVAKQSTKDATATARFIVPSRDLELDHPAADPAMMNQLAKITAAAGGAAMAPEELPTLIADLAKQPAEYEEEVLARKSYWDTWPFFLLFVAVMSVEWGLRKRWGLV